MRLILCQTHLDTTSPPELPSDTFVFVCFEDFSVGPVGDWGDFATFRRKRSEYWHRTQMLDLPDGDKIDYFVWFQALPRYDLVELIKSGVGYDDMPETHEFDDLIHEARRIEVWHDQSVRGCVFWWYVVAALNDIGIPRGRVSACKLPNLIRERQTEQFWSDMLLDTPARALPATPVPDPDWRQALLLWEALTELPDPVDPQILQQADNSARDALATVARRYPDPSTGLSNLQERLLRATTHEWQKMARVIGDAMGAGWDENDSVGDYVLRLELDEMARMEPPLVEIKGEGAMPYCRVRLASERAT